VVPRVVVTAQSTTRARKGRDRRRAGSEGIRQPRCLEDPGEFDGRSWGSGDREGGKVQPPFAQGERVGHRWLRDYTLDEYVGQVGLCATSRLECGMAGWIEDGYPQGAPLQEGRRAEVIRGAGSALSGGAAKSAGTSGCRQTRPRSRFVRHGPAGRSEESHARARRQSGSPIRIAACHRTDHACPDSSRAPSSSTSTPASRTRRLPIRRNECP